MINKIFKILFLNWKSYFLFVVIAVTLSLFSYLFSLNTISSINWLMREEIKPIVWWDIVISSNEWKIDIKLLEDFKDKFEIAKSIEIYTTLFDDYNENSYLYKVTYHTDNFPFYSDLIIDKINDNWIINVDKNSYEIFWENLEILWNNFDVKWIIIKDITSNIWIFSDENKIYLPINYWDDNLDISNSRIEYKYFFKLTDYNYQNQIWIIKNEIESKLWTNIEYRIRSLDDWDQNIEQITDRLYVYINFFNLIIFTITFFIIILSLEIFFKKIKNNIWTLKIFWLTNKKIFFYVWLFIISLFIISFILAILWNYIIINILNNSFNFFFFEHSNLINLIKITIILTLVWSLSPFYKISKSKIQDLIKDEWNFSNFWKKDYFIYLLIIFIWFLWINLSSNIKIIEWFIYSSIFIISIIFIYIIINYLLKIFFWILKKQIKDFYIFDWIRSTIKPWNLSFLIIFTSIISFISIFTFLVFSNTFINYLWNLNKISNDMFIINAQESDLEILEKYFEKDEIFEIINMRIEKINWQTLSEFIWTERVWREFTREFNSTTNILNNRIIRWQVLKEWYVSVDKEFWDRLWLKIWDNITFDIAGLKKTLTVTNFREAVRNWTNPFFFFQLHENDFKWFPKTYIVSYDSKNKAENITYTLSREIWPYLSYINTSDIIEIVVEISKQVQKVINIALWYIFIFSILSFIVSISFLITFKKEKTKILNKLWWEINKLKNWIKIEYIYLVWIWYWISIILWSIWLISIFKIIWYFQLNIIAFMQWIIITSILSIFYYIILKKSINNI